MVKKKGKSDSDSEDFREESQFLPDDCVNGDMDSEDGLENDISTEERSFALTGHGAGGISTEDLNDICEGAEGEDNLRAVISDYFIEYASYVIKDRAIPDVDDGMKPVQRRIMHVLDKMDDGNMHKVNTVVGAAMAYHPHGDASISGALVVMANKDFFIEKQGNFGDILTGAEAAAGRYIECRLSPLGREVLFSHDVTEYVDTYDSRNKEPVRLPSKIPTLLLMGADGIAVGMNTKIFSHNFRELLEAQIAILENRPFQVFPDFQQGGLMDVSEYEDGAGCVRLRAVIEPEGDKKVIIREIPAYTTTRKVISSIEEMAKKGKLKIASITDYTSEGVEIEIALQRNVYASEVIKELYAYTCCQLKVYSNILVIQDNTPIVMTVSQVLRRNTEKLVSILQGELLIELHDNEDKFHAKTLERIFVEHRIYKRIEECESLEEVKQECRLGFEPYLDQLHKEITDDDITRLLQIPIRRISRFDFDRNFREVNEVVKEIRRVKHNLKHLVEYAIAYIRKLLDKYGDQYPRRTKICNFGNINARDIARRDIKIYLDRVNGFIGSSVKSSNKTDIPLVCTEYDKIMVLGADGILKMLNVTEKEYVGQIKYYGVLDKEQVFSMLYRDKKQGTWFAKRFQVGQYITGKEYHTTPEGCVIEKIYQTGNPVVNLQLTPNPRRSYNEVVVDFSTYDIRSKEARGFKLTSYPVENVILVSRGFDSVAESVGNGGDKTADNVEKTDKTTESSESTPEITPIVIPALNINLDDADDYEEVSIPRVVKSSSESNVNAEKTVASESVDVTSAKDSADAKRKIKKAINETSRQSKASTSSRQVSNQEDDIVLPEEPVLKQPKENQRENTPPSKESSENKEDVQKRETSSEKSPRRLPNKKLVDEDSPFFLE